MHLELDSLTYDWTILYLFLYKLFNNIINKNFLHKSLIDFIIVSYLILIHKVVQLSEYLLLHHSIDIIINKVLYEIAFLFQQLGDKVLYPFILCSNCTPFRFGFSKMMYFIAKQDFQTYSNNCIRFLTLPQIPSIWLEMHHVSKLQSHVHHCLSNWAYLKLAYDIEGYNITSFNNL